MKHLKEAIMMGQVMDRIFQEGWPFHLGLHPNQEYKDRWSVWIFGPEGGNLSIQYLLYYQLDNTGRLMLISVLPDGMVSVLCNMDGLRPVSWWKIDEHDTWRYHVQLKNDEHSLELETDTGPEGKCVYVTFDELIDHESFSSYCNFSLSSPE